MPYEGCPLCGPNAGAIGSAKRNAKYDACARVVTAVVARAERPLGFGEIFDRAPRPWCREHLRSGAMHAEESGALKLTRDWAFAARKLNRTAATRFRNAKAIPRAEFIEALRAFVRDTYAEYDEAQTQADWDRRDRLGGQARLAGRLLDKLLTEET